MGHVAVRERGAGRGASMVWMERHHRLLVIAGVALALILRLVFVLRLPQLPLYWDEVHYNAWASGWAHAWRALGSPTFLQDLRAAFEASLQRGEAYSAFVGLVYALAGASPRVVFWVQAVLDTLTCALVYGVGRELGGRRVGLLALVLAAVYEPFIFSIGRLQTETLCSFLYVGALCAVLSQPRRRGAAVPLLGGLLMALAMLVRPALDFLFPLLVVLLIVVHWRVGRRWTAALAFSAGFFLLIGPRLVLTDALLGAPLWGGTLDPSRYVYAGVVVANGGWDTDRVSFANPPREELLAVLREQGTQEATDADFRRAAVLTLERHPVQSAAVVLHKLYEAWRHPYNDSLRRLLLSGRGQRGVHQGLLVLGTLGLLLALRNWRVGLPLVVTAAYLWGTYLAMKIEVRYVVTVMPLMVCLAALTLDTLARGLVIEWRSRQRRVVVALTLTACTVIVLLEGSPVGRLLQLFSGLSPDTAHALRLGGTLSVVVVLAALVGTALAAERSGPCTVAAVLLPLGLGLLVLLVGRPMAGSWRQWRCPLTDSQGILRQEFFVPADWPPPGQAQLRFDAAALDASGRDLVVTVNGTEARRFVGGLKRADAVPTESYYDDIFAGQGRAQRPWHAWYAVPVALASVAPGATL